MACAAENYPYPRSKKAMEDDVLTIDDVASHVTHRGAYNGVRIREFDDGNVNPQPLKKDEESDNLWEEFLSPNKLKSLTGVNNLTDVTYLEMQVNTHDHSLGNFGGLLPNLIQLKLSNSIISTVRDLGTCLTNLKTLWMCRCGLTDLDGISSISYLVELYVAFNDISDVSPVSMLDNLEVLDLEGNLIDDLSQVEFLTLCSSIKSLNLEGNPVCIASHPTSTADEMANYEYREAVHQAIPSLKVLDDELLLVEKVGGKAVLRDMPDSAKNTKVPDHLKSEWQLINDGLKVVESEQEQEESSNSRPSSAKNTSRPKTATARQRPSSAARQRPSSAARQRPGTAFGQRPGSALGSSGSQSELTGIFQVEDDSSDLTHGSGEVICGNISKALKARRKNIENVKSAVPPFSNESRLHVPEKSYEEELPTTPSKKDIFEELKEWRQQFTKFIDKDHSLQRTRIDSESSQSESDSPFSSPRTPDTSPSSPPIDQRPSISPTPPPSSNPKRPSPMGRSLPSAPLVGRDLDRPHTSGEFRIRRYRQASTEQPVNSLRTIKVGGSLNLDANENHPSMSSLDSRVPMPGVEVLDNEPRSSSAPVRALRRYRVLPNTPGTPPDPRPPDDTPQPPSQSPVSPSSHGFRPGTAAAALQKRRLKPNHKI